MSVPTRTRLAELLEPLVPDEGARESVLPNVRVFKTSQPMSRATALYIPGIGVMAQGSKRVWLGDKSYTYDADNFFVLATTMPVECQTNTSEDEPVMGLWITVDSILVGELLLAMDDAAGIDSQSFISSVSLTRDVLDTTERLVLALSSPLDARVMGPQLIRELVYRVLLTEQGNVLRLIASNPSRHGQIARTLRRIQVDYAQGLDVASLAQEARMGLTAFHEAFREVTATSPVQYIKSVRLHHARMLLAVDGITAQEAAQRVGYLSASQFSREYRRMFGVSPASDRAASPV